MLSAEMDALSAELEALVSEQNLTLADAVVDDVLTYALFPQVGLKFLQNRGDAAAFEPVPSAAPTAAAQPTAEVSQGSTVENYSVAVDGKVYQVQVAAGDTHIQPVQASVAAPQSSAATPLQAGLAGTVNKLLVTPGEIVTAGQTLLILEAMKMETEVSATAAGTVAEVLVRQGDAVVVGQNLLTIAEA